MGKNQKTEILNFKYQPIHRSSSTSYLNMPMNTMMTMPAMRTGRRPEKAKAAMARSVLEGTW